jgi:hypothetical protein
MERAWLRATLAEVAGVACPSDLDALGLRDHVVEGALDALDDLPSHTRVPLMVAIRVYRLSARAARLRGVDAAEHFESWWSSRSEGRRSVVRALRAALVVPYYEHPAVMAAIGYDGRSWVEERKAAFEARHTDDLAAHRRIVLEESRP